MTVLTPEDDAFGAALLAHLEDRTNGRVLMLEINDGRSMPAMEPASFFAGYEEWLRWERELLAGIEGPVLDLGCGAGRHLVHLQAQGLRVTGVDISPGSIEVCRRRGVRDVRLADLRTPPDDERWQAVLMLCGNFGLAGSWNETRTLLTELHRVCAPGAVLVADSVDPLTATDRVSLAYRAAKQAIGRHPGEIDLRLRFGDLVTPYWSLLNLPFDEVPSIVHETGWELEKHLRDGADHALRLRRS